MKVTNEIIKEYRKMVAVYKIYNKINGKFYIGSSIDLGERWKSHIDELNRNVHDNFHLQNAWNKYIGIL